MIALTPNSEPPPPPPGSSDDRPNRERRPFFIGGELGWNGLAGLGVNFSYHPIPNLAFDSGLGIAAPGFRLGLRARVNFLTSAWTPFAGFGITYAGGADEPIDVQFEGESSQLEVLPSPYLQLAAGVNYTGDEGFVFMATSGYAVLLKENTRYVSGSQRTFSEYEKVLGGGIILSVAFGYAF